MNLPTLPPPAANRSTAADSPGRARDDAPPHGARDAFERVLQARRQAPRDEDEESPSDDAASAAASAAPGPAPLAARALASPAAGSAGAVDTATGTRASLEAALQSQAGPAVTPIQGLDPVHVWEATLRGPDAMAMQLRAERLTTPGTPPSWGLTIGAPVPGAELMARHLPRLHERMRKHGIELDHVRIEQDDEDAR